MGRQAFGGGGDDRGVDRHRPWARRSESRPIAPMAEPLPDGSNVDAGFEQVHRGTVPHAVGMQAFGGQRRRGGCGRGGSTFGASSAPRSGSGGCRDDSRTRPRAAPARHPVRRARRAGRRRSTARAGGAAPSGPCPSSAGGGASRRRSPTESVTISWTRVPAGTAEGFRDLGRAVTEEGMKGGEPQGMDRPRA